MSNKTTKRIVIGIIAGLLLLMSVAPTFAMVKQCNDGTGIVWSGGGGGGGDKC